jgi:hypothetical protein
VSYIQRSSHKLFLQKGQVQRFALLGNSSRASNPVADYMKQTSSASEKNPKKIDSASKQVNWSLFLSALRGSSSTEILARGHWCEHSEGTPGCTEEDGNQTRVIASAPF